ncbi:MAG: hypothetical protein ACQXXJ_07805, partial [Candidatus Bathyarchaeia archaeon]
MGRNIKYIFSRKYFRYINPITCMRKLTDDKKLLWCLRQYHQGKESQKWLACYLGVSTRQFRKLYSKYKQTGQLPKPKMGRPQKPTPQHWEDLVETQWNKTHTNAFYLEKIIDLEHKQRIPHNTIHKIMLAKGYASEQESKQKRRKPWIRYERTHSLSAIHMDWHISR